MHTITPLDETIVKQLTTAQVITSVFSAVKELVENALDAGAGTIDVILEEQGLSLIEVRDNAKGISDVDSTCIALPAYTSKLFSFNDFESLETYGFRGEALNALCSVSDVKIITRTEKDNAARCYTFNHNGTIEKQEYCARSLGTTIRVYSLLKNIPVRRKIISSKRCAYQNIEEIECLLQDLGICNPNVRINYKVDNINRFIKLPTNTVNESLISIFNKKLISNYQFLYYNNSNMNIEVIVPKMKLTDLSFACQKFYSRIYINKRPVLYKELEKLIMRIISKYFDEIMPSNRKIIFFLIINVLPSDVDVNLEPNKTKVFLKNMSKISKVVEKLLIDYYKLSKTDQFELTSTLIDDSTVALIDNVGSKDGEIDEEILSCKERIVDNKESTLNFNYPDIQVNIKSQDIISEIIETLNNTESEENETFSQLPKVDLGPDFSTQHINNIPILNQESVQNVRNKLEQVMDVPKPAANPPVKPTLAQWSKGQLKNLKGGTDIEVLGPSSVPTKINKQLNDSHTNPNTRGFLKFSEKMGQKIRKENPEIDFVTMATLIASKWKELAKERREYYRELGRNDILVDPKLNLISGKKRLSTISKNDVENNQKRMKNMMDKMEKLNANKYYRKRDDVEVNTKNCKAKIRSVRNWKIDKEKLYNSYQNKCQMEEKRDYIIGQVDDNIWIVTTSSQIWALNINYLFDVLNLNKQEQEEAKMEQKMVEIYFKRGLDEAYIDFMHPIHTI